MRWRFLWRRVVIGPRRPALCRHHPEPRGSGGGGRHAEVVPGSTLLQRRRAAPGLRAPLQLLRVGVRGWGGCVLLCVGPVGPLRCSGPLLGGGRCSVPPPPRKLTVHHRKKPPYGHQVMRGQPPVTPGQLPAPTFVPVTVEPGAIPTLIYAESSISILQLLEPGDAVSLTPPVSPTVLPAAVVQLEGSDILIKEACLQPDQVTLELSGAVTIMCHQDGDVVVYSAATRGDRV
eukprot:XP_025011724.1 uncharacterized protein LOC112533561 [Gallus gallus]